MEKHTAKNVQYVPETYNIVRAKIKISTHIQNAHTHIDSLLENLKLDIQRTSNRLLYNFMKLLLYL